MIRCLWIGILPDRLLVKYNIIFILNHSPPSVRTLEGAIYESSLLVWTLCSTLPNSTSQINGPLRTYKCFPFTRAYFAVRWYWKRYLFSRITFDCALLQFSVLLYPSMVLFLWDDGKCENVILSSLCSEVHKFNCNDEEYGGTLHD